MVYFIRELFWSEVAFLSIIGLPVVLIIAVYFILCAIGCISNDSDNDDESGKRKDESDDEPNDKAEELFHESDGKAEELGNGKGEEESNGE